MRLTASVALINCAALAQTPDLKSVSGDPKMIQKQVAWIERTAEEMPEEEYAFRPDPASRSLVRFSATSPTPTTFFCSTVLGEAARRRGSKTNTKAELHAALHDAFTYCNRAYEALPMPAASTCPP